MSIRIGGQHSTQFAPEGPGFLRTPTVFGALSGLSEIGLGIAFLITWKDPDVFGHFMVRFALELMLLEFILVHSAGFMGLKANPGSPPLKRIGWFAGLGAFYSLFVLGFCLSLDTWRPMITFWVITLQRLGGSLFDPKPSEETKAWFGTDLALNVVLYLGFVMMTIIIPLPRLGITRGVRESLSLGSGGLWVDEPHRVVILAGLYFLLRGYFTATARPRKTWPAPGNG